ncbi:MAG: HD domain-containing protein [Dehalococcoidia bacterium]|nr:HD domain-containing protein [Dehalococcoidia bacterium]
MTERLPSEPPPAGAARGNGLARPLSVLLLEDNDFDAELVIASLQGHGYAVRATRARNAQEYRAHLAGDYDLLILDYSLPQFDAHAAIAMARGAGVETPILVVTGSLDDEAAVRCIKEGAFDYLLKDRLARLGNAVGQALQERRLRVEKQQLADRERQQAERLNALRLIDVTITGSLDVNVTLNVLLDQATTILGVDAASVLLVDAFTGKLRFAQGHGFRSRRIQERAMSVGEGLAGRVAATGRTVYVADLLEEHSLLGEDLIAEEGFRSYHGIPLVAKGATKGVLELFRHTPFVPNADWTDFVHAIATQAAIALDNAQLFDDMQRANLALEEAYNSTLEGWARTLELRDHETGGHSERVVALSREIGREAGFDASELADLKRGALLHDLGKVAIPDAVLLKPGPLNEEEWTIMRKHPEYGYRLLSGIPYLSEAVKVTYSHHERWDGTGYPDGLRGEHIPALARAFSLADVYDALRSERPYKQPWARTDVIAYIKDQSGLLFDPEMVEAFKRLPDDVLP